MASSDCLAGLYVHVPFCTSVCPYCDFAVTIAGGERRQAFLAAVDVEAARSADLGLAFDTVYLGGGTPSSLSPDELARLVDSVRRSLEVRDPAAMYLEVNPEDVTPDAVRGWRDLGFGSISIGVQSFDDRTLEWLGRRHSAAAARKALETVQGAGFGTVSIDLIYAVEGQAADDWRRQLEEAAALGPDHLSCYQLTLHPATVFGRRMAAGRMKEPSEPAQAELFFLTHELLADAGYQGYEVSNFASAPGHRSLHNTKYWNHAPYLGLGPSAHSFVSNRRWWNPRKLRLWQRALADGRPPVEAEEELTPRQLALEAVMLGLRTSDGVDLERLSRDYDVDLMGLNLEAIDALVSSGHLRIGDGRLRPTIAGMAIADSLAARLEVSPTTGM